MNSTASTPARLAGAGETKAKSQARLILGRFVQHKLAIVSLIVALGIIVLAYSSIGFAGIPGWWKHTYQALNPLVNEGKPTLSLIPEWLGGAGMALGEHPFGQDRIGKDYFAMTMRGIQNSVTVMVVVAAVSTLLGTVIGGFAGYYRGRIDNILMRLTDLVIIIPILIIAAVAARIAGNLGGVVFLALLLGCLTWTNLARLVRAEFLSYREREFVEAARLAGASDPRVIFVHILPNTIGVVVVAATLVMSSAVLLEAGLSYLGLGIQAPDVSLGGLISQNQTSAMLRPWLFWWPGSFIILLALSANFIGDGLRDAFDPRQRKFRLRRTPRRAATIQGSNA